MSLYLPPFYCIFKKEFFRKFSKFGVLHLAIFFEKFPKISRKFLDFFSTFSKSTKATIFVPKVVQNHYINQNLAKFFLETPKIANFSLKIIDFSKFSVPSAPKIRNFLKDALSPENFEKTPQFITVCGDFTPSLYPVLVPYPQNVQKESNLAPKASLRSGTVKT